TNLLDHRYGMPDQFLAVGRGELHHHHYSIARQRLELDAPALFRLGATCDWLLAFAGLSPARGRCGSATHGQRVAYQLFPADRPRRFRPTLAYQRRRQPAALAASFLVPG